ncbi:MAG: hypothetical protein JSS27_11385 [Planctomycetes bacterium]|nr:hypothetical protein [Planctomycetota bacterium]
MSPDPRESTPVAEHSFHRYVGNRIPWYVRLLWLMFWIGAVYYVIVYVFPALQIELLRPVQ